MKAVEVELLMKGNLSQGMLDAQTKANLLDESLKRVGMTIGGVFTAQKAVEFVKTMIDVRQEVENLSISFETLLGGKDKATQFFGELREYAVNTPLMLNDLAGGAQTMLGFNMEAEKVIPTLKQIGDISMGDRDRFNSLVLAFSQMSATGKLMGQDLLQMINAGFNPLAIISEKTGKSIGQLKDEMSAGAISSEMVAQAFADATAEGGKFHGMLDKQSKGLKGQISNLEGAIDNMFNAMGEKSEGILTGSVEVASELVKNYEAVGKALMSLVAVYGSYKTALIATLAVQKAASFVENIRLVAMFRKELGLATAAQQAFNITANANPYVLLATVILSAAAALAIYSKNCSAAADEAQRAADREKEQTDAINDKKEAIEKCISTITDENLAELDRLEALEKLKKLMPSVFEKYKTEKELIDKLTEARREYNEELREERNLKGEGNLKADQQRVADLKKYLKLRKQYYKTGRLNMSDSDYNLYQNLDKKYNKEVRNVRGTFQTFNSAIESLIKASEGTVWKDVQQVRTDNHNKFMAKLNSMNAETAQKTINFYKNCISSANKQGKKLVQLPGESVATSVDELQNRIKSATARMKSIHENASKDFMKDAKTAWTNAQNEVNKVIKNRNNRSLYPDEASYLAALRKARDEEKKAKANYEAAGGDTSKKTKKTKNTGLTPQEKANIKAAEQEEKGRQVEAAQRKQEASEKQTAFDLKQAEIDGLQEGFDKELETINLNYDKLIEANRLRQQEWVDELQNISDLSFEQAHPNWKKQGLKRPTVTMDDLSADQKNYLKQYTEAANAYKQNSEAKLYQNLLAKYQDYEEQRKSISEKFAKDRAQIEKAVDADGRPIGEDVKERALAELSKQERAALKSVDDAQLTELGKENKVLVDLFADTSEKSVAEVQKIIDRIKVLMDYLRGPKDAEGTAVIKDGNGKTERRITQKDMAGLGFSPAELKALEKSPEKLKALTEQYEKLKKEVLGKNPFRALADAVGELFKHGEDGEDKGLEAKLKRLGESAAASAEMVGDLTGRLSEMFEAAGNDGMAEAMDAVQGVMTSVSNIGRGFAEGGVVGGIAAAAGEAIGWVTKAFQASARHKAALEKIMEEVTAQQREYNLLLMEQNLELEKAQTIFGTDTYGKAANAVRVMKDAYAGLKAEIAGTAEQQKKFGYTETGSAFWNKIVNKGYSELKDAYSGLADIEIKTGHKKTGLFGWGKGKDTYSSILDVYPELIDSAGNFNRELAESIMNSREFAKNDKEALQYIIDLYDQAEEAWESVKDYFEGVFGDLGQTLTDALVDAFKNGTDAGKAFADSLTGMLEKLAEQMIYTVTIAPLLEKAQEEMLDVMKREDLTDEEKFGNYVRILDEMTDNALSQQGTINALLEKYRQLAKDKGLDLWQGDSTTQTGKSGAYTTASQESITKLEGLYTAMLVHETNIDTNVENVAGSMQTALGHLKRIDTNTGECSETLKLMRKDMRDMKDDLTTLRRDGIKTR
jgi:tape measure domain-containing protein